MKNFIFHILQNLDATQKSNLKYLELGISDGANHRSLTGLKLTSSVDVSNHGNPTFHGKTDDFFLQNKEIYDIIYIDASHSCLDVAKDFNNSLDFLSDNGIIFMHDMYPPSEHYACYSHCGDAFNVLNYMLDKHYNLKVYNDDFGLTAVLDKRKIDLAKLQEVSYNEFSAKYNHDIRVDDNEFTNYVKTIF